MVILREPFIHQRMSQLLRRLPQPLPYLVADLRNLLIAPVNATPEVSLLVGGDEWFDLVLDEVQFFRLFGHEAVLFLVPWEFYGFGDRGGIVFVFKIIRFRLTLIRYNALIIFNFILFLLQQALFTRSLTQERRPTVIITVVDHLTRFILFIVHDHLSIKYNYKTKMDISLPSLAELNELSQNLELSENAQAPPVVVVLSSDDEEFPEEADEPINVPE